MSKRLPIDYIAWTRARYADHPPYQWTVNETAPPLVPLRKPLSETRIGLVSSGGFVWRDQPPFDEEKNDLTFREIPKDADLSEVRISHHSRYFVREERYDLNCTLPLERLRELEAEGHIGGLASPVYTFMGRCFLRTRLQRELAPELLARLRAQEVDAALLVPA